MSWHGHLQLNYRRAGERTVVDDRHRGPLRVLRSLHPEGAAVCHSVLVHPPGGIVGGDALEIEAQIGEGAHALITTAGATRFYRSRGEAATQSVSARLATGARLEWLPLETIAFNGCLGESRIRVELAPGAETIGWDVLALGLPASNQPFERGRFVQSIEWPGHWLERGAIDAADRRLLDSPLGLAGHRTVGTLWFAAGSAFDDARRSALLAAARAVVETHPLRSSAGVTAPQPDVVVARVLAPLVEPAMTLLTDIWRTWREHGWGLGAASPRVWRT